MNHDLLNDIYAYVIIAVLFVLLIVVSIILIKYYFLIDIKKKEFIENLRANNDEHGLSVIAEYRHITCTFTELFSKNGKTKLPK